jgi:hypothetical protein
VPFERVEHFETLTVRYKVASLAGRLTLRRGRFWPVPRHPGTPEEKNMLKTSAIAMTLLFAVSAAGAASAATAWEKSHPRRDQVNDRLENQNRRIHEEVKEGELTRAQAAKLHRQDHRVREEERAMASWHGGHITKPEQAALNRQENRISREIGE